MKPGRVDYVVDLAYGAMIFVSVVLIIAVGTRIGVAFGVGVLFSYGIHVAWKMGRFDPEWMTQEVTENVEQTLTQEVDEIIARLDEVNERIGRRPRADEIEETVGGMLDEDEDPERER